MRCSPVVVLLALACTAAPAPTAEGQAPPKPAAATYGQPVRQGAALNVAQVVADPASHAEKSVLVEGAVRRACSRRGCWMELADAMQESAPGCRVTFRDYGFFVPTDSPGARARVDGVVKTRDLSPEEVAHMEREGARFASKREDGSVREVSLVATGVELRRL